MVNTKSNIIIIFLVLCLTFSFTSAQSFGYNYLDNQQTGSIIINGSNYTINVNNSDYWQGHTGTDGSWLTGISTYNATYDAKNSSQWVTNGNDIYNGNSGDVGIGMTDPQGKFHVQIAPSETLSFRDQGTVGGDAGTFGIHAINASYNNWQKLAIDGSSIALNSASKGNLGVGLVPSSEIGLDVLKTSTVYNGLVHGAIRNQGTYNPDVNSPDFNVGISNLAEKTGVNNMTGEYGGGGLAGLINIARNNGVGTVKYAYGSIQSVQSVGGGVVENAYSLYVPAPYIVGAGSSITNNYGIFIGDQSYGTGVNYAIYSQGGANYFGGATTFNSALVVGGFNTVYGGSVVTGGSDWTSLPAYGYGVYTGYTGGHGYISSVGPGIAGQQLDILGYPTRFLSAQTGVEIMRVSTDYSVGIGTTSPLAPLHIKANTVNGNFGRIRIEADSGVGGAETYEMRQGIVGVSNGGFSISDITNSVIPFVIQATTHNVGIGTTTPAVKLQVEGTTGEIARIGDTVNNNMVLRIGNYGSPNYGNYIDSVQGNVLSTAWPLILNPTGGKVGIGTNNPTHTLDVYGAYTDVNTPILDVGGDSGSVIGMSIAGVLKSKFRTDSSGGFALESTGTGGIAFNYAGGSGDTTFWNGGGGLLMTLLNNGNLGIGVYPPAYKLDVAGDTRIVGKTNITGDLIVGGNLSVNGNRGLTKTIQIVKDVDLVGLTKTYCNMTYTGGILTNTTC